MNDYYQPHHQALTEAVQSILDYQRRALVIDCHSFSSKPLPHEDHQSKHRADICIGTDDFHTSPELCQ